MTFWWKPSKRGKIRNSRLASLRSPYFGKRMAFCLRNFFKQFNKWRNNSEVNRAVSSFRKTLVGQSWNDVQWPLNFFPSGLYITYFQIPRGCYLDQTMTILPKNVFGKVSQQGDVDRKIFFFIIGRYIWNLLKTQSANIFELLIFVDNSEILSLPLNTISSNILSGQKTIP